MATNKRSEIESGLKLIETQLRELEKLVEEGSDKDTILKKIWQCLDTRSALQKTSTKTMRNRDNKRFQRPDHNLLLTSDVLQDLANRLTVDEILKKYKIGSASTFYKHLRESYLADVDLKRLKTDPEYVKNLLEAHANDRKNMYF